MSLNPAQQAAVDHRGRPLLVLAGAGTGKTRVIIHRVASLLDQGTPPWRILAVTFTNKAAAEMRSRIDTLCGRDHDVGELWVGTFHAICARILRRFGDSLGLTSRFTIYDVADQSTLMTRVLKELNVGDRLYTPRGVLSHIDRAKNKGYGPDDLERIGLQDPVRSVVRKAFARYQERLRAADAVDFGDLLLLTVKLLRTAQLPRDGQLGDLDPMVRFSHQFQHVVVDEFQDTNPVQAELVDRLALRAELSVVGDDDQAIYGWRGADVEQILQFPERHEGTEIIRLEQNYRSTMNILRCADAVIRRNHGRLGKALWSDNGDGDPVRVVRLPDERDEARFVATAAQTAIEQGADPNDVAVFYRTHAQSRVIEDEVRRSGLGVRIVGGVAFYERQEVKDVLAYLTVLGNPRSDAHVLRVINRPTRGIGGTTQERIASAASQAGCSLWEAMANPEAAGVGSAARRKIGAFMTMMGELMEAMGGLRLDALLARVIDATGYREHLMVEATDEAATRLENLQELHGNVEEFLRERPEGTLAEYLELVSLVRGERSDGAAGALTLMTVHSAKGLEFDHVFLTGMEERVFPHARVFDDPVQLEEERRLAYVALTRARRTLTVTTVARRRIFGQEQVGTLSRFVRDLPSEAVEYVGSRGSSRSASSRSSRPGDWRADIEYDHGEASDAALDALDADLGVMDESVSLYVGMAVRHAKFGVAEVIGWSGSGADLKLRLRLSTAEVKTIMAQYCRPI